MKKIEKAQEISRILNRIYRKVPIPLNHKNKFELVVATTNSNLFLWLRGIGTFLYIRFSILEISCAFSIFFTISSLLQGLCLN